MYSRSLDYVVRDWFDDIVGFDTATFFYKADALYFAQNYFKQHDIDCSKVYVYKKGLFFNKLVAAFDSKGKRIDVPSCECKRIIKDE